MKPEHRLHIARPEYRSRVERSVRAVRRAAELGRVGVSFSGGKDSTVLLHLVRSVLPDAPAAFFDSGCELRSTLDLVAHYGVRTIRPRIDYPSLARFSGWWGYRDPVDPGCPWQVKAILVDEPSEVFVVEERLSVVAMGLRAEESRGRKMNAATRGELYQGADRTHYLCPLQWWTEADVWAYIAQHALRYNAAYDTMERLGIPPKKRRVGPLLNTNVRSCGAIAMLRSIEPQTFAALAYEFPQLREAT